MFFKKVEYRIYTLLNSVIDNTVYIHYFGVHKCVNPEKPAKNSKYGFEFFFRAHLADLVFLVICISI